LQLLICNRNLLIQLLLSWLRLLRLFLMLLIHLIVVIAVIDCWLGGAEEAIGEVLLVAVDWQAFLAPLLVN
jgi:hypothetical protein